MAVEIEEKQVLDCYKESVLHYSRQSQKYFLRQLKNDGYYTEDAQCAIDQKPNVFIGEKNQDLEETIGLLAALPLYATHFEFWEFSKLYKYSVPFFFSLSEGKNLTTLLQEAGCREYQRDSFIMDKSLGNKLCETVPYFFRKDSAVLLKFVLRKAFLRPDQEQPINYRFPIVVYINTACSVLDIRFDSVRYDEQFEKDAYEKLLNECIQWLKDKLSINLFLCDHRNAISVFNDKTDERVKICKQLMEMSSGGSAELTASEEMNYVLPFIGELRELIDNNKELFDASPRAMELVLGYLADKEATANYPYVHIKCVKPIVADSYIVKITFDFYCGKYTGLQHITGKCRDLGMERMNDAIEYLCTSSSFTKGDAV